MPEATNETKVVLIVDPDGVESGGLGRSLKQLGCEPQSCLDMHAALIASRAERPALVIVSADLLDGDGFMLCDQLRAEPTLKGVPVILLCGESAAGATVKAHEASPNRANAYLFRPLSVAAIVERAAAFLTHGCSVQTSVDDDEISISSAVEVVQPGSTKRPPPRKKAVSKSASLAPPPLRSALPPPPRVPRPPTAFKSTAPPPRSSVRAPLPPPSRPPARGSNLPTDDSSALREQLDARDREIGRLREELHAVEARHSAALAKQREELEQAYSAKYDAALAKARQSAQSDIRALDRLTEQLAEMMHQRDKARADLARSVESMSRARDSLVEAMHGVDLARAHASAPSG